MVSQTTVSESRNGNRTPARAVAGNIADVAHDLTLLAELQAQLLAADLKQTGRKLALPAGLALVALAIALGSFPVFLLAVAALLVQAGMALWGALAVAAALGLVLAGVLLGAAWLGIRSNLKILDRSREEFARNLDWVKNVLRKSGRSWRTDQAGTAGGMPPAG